MEYILGIDVGTTSLGWCLLNSMKGEPTAIQDMGVRIFSDGRNAQQEPLAVTRRDARGMRRRLDRCLERKQNLINYLIDIGLMPSSSEERKRLEQLNPYFIRDNASKKEVTKYELGRALIHICQRRGFKSNRKSDKNNNDRGEMKTSILELYQKIKDSGCYTFGQYLYQLQQQDEHARLRVDTSVVKNKNHYNFYPDRKLYEDEVDLILSHQTLSDKEIKDIKHIIFFQRPLKKAVVGKCIFEEAELRAPKASPTFQKFRYLQTLNNLEFDDIECGELLSDEQRKTIGELLKKSNNVKFSSIRKKLKTTLSFNFEDEKRTSIEGDETANMLSNKKAFGDEWFSLNALEQEKIVDILLNEEDENKIIETLTKKYFLTDEQAEYISNINLPSGYCNLSLKALHKILPFLQQGLEYSKACEQAGYHHSFFESKTFDFLPYYGEALSKEVIGGSLDPKDMEEVRWGKINNPTVHIGLNQIRKLVNEIIKTYGKPNQISLEVARDLKLSKKQKQDLQKEQTANTKENERIKAELEKSGIKNSYDNRMIMKLWEDSNKDPLKRVCPFCGKQIPIAKLFSGEFEIEHLVPFSRCFNDSRANKVLSCRDCNRTKLNKVPFEAFSHETERWKAILARVEALPQNKQWRFKEDVMELLKGKSESILARQLNDTKYLAVATKKYLSSVCLPNKIRTIPGQLTALMRQAWGFNSLIGDNDTKDRSDHRHHSIDALTIACTNVSTLQKLSRESEKNWKEKQKLLSGEILPFPTFNRQDLNDLLSSMVISHKPDHGGAKEVIKQGKTVACLHEDTNYGFISIDETKKEGIFAVRKPIISLLEDKNISEIGDRAIREELQKRLQGKTEKIERASIIADYAKDNGIKSVRLHIKKSMDTMRGIKEKHGDKIYRYVATGGNYCAEIYMPNRGKDKGKWCAEIISNFDAHQKNFIPKWRKAEPEAKLIMRLFIDDMVAYDKDGKTVICRVKKLTKPDRIYLTPHNIAKEEGDKLSWGAYPEPLRKANARRISVNVLGKVLDPKT